ncbi:MAG: protein kinase, partial [Lentisphaerae bacterium]|nr:protein kinase [Lentisphaerota bacterium]
MKLEKVLTAIAGLGGTDKTYKPHRHLALMSVLRLVRDGHIQSCEVHFDSQFQKVFKEFLDEHGTPSDRNRPHAPFFHLKVLSFWQLVPNEGHEEELEGASTVGSAGQLRHLVKHAELDYSVLDLMKEDSTAGVIQKELAQLVKRGNLARRDPGAVVSDGPAQNSLFQHEADALRAIDQRIRGASLGTMLGNLDVHDSQSNRYFETDAVVIAPFGIYVVELKHWSGRIEVRPNSWLQNRSFFKRDPHRSNGFKARLLKGLYERRFPSFPSLFFESVVVLTNPDAVIHGVSVASTSGHNPTLAGIDKFVQYLKKQKKTGQASLSATHCEEFLAYLRTLQTEGRPRDFEFPGYEIISRLYQHTDRAEVVARRKDVRYRRLTRLRIFFPPSPGSEHNALVCQERATATLNAVAQVGEHPNILNVWAVPNENNYVVEGSEWSDTGTLRDVMQDRGPLRLEDALRIARGILTGLGVLHSKPVVHRSLSPENVLMVGGVPKLMNFDLSYQLEDDRTTVIPDVSKLRRSPYMAPEVYASGTTPEASADLFSVGVIMYEMLTETRPFSCSTDLSQMGGALRPNHVKELEAAGVPLYVRDSLCALVRSEPGDRPGQAVDVLALLDPAEVAAPSLELDPELPPDSDHDIYTISEFLGTGAEAQLYRANDRRGRSYAIKLFNTDVPQQRVLDEYERAGAVQHPSIVRVNNHGRWKELRRFIAFDWVSPRSLREDIVQGIRPDLRSFRDVALQLLSAIKALHGASTESGPHPLVHNDIKPENILLTDGDRPVLVDFGSAIQLEDSGHPTIQPYEGTYGYVAPDLQLGEDRQYCEDGDLYALGVALSEWLLGRRTLAGDAVVIAQTLGGGESLGEWLGKATAPKAEDRFSSVAEMSEALLSALAEPRPQEAQALPQTPPEEEFPPLSHTLERLEPSAQRDPQTRPNPFVAYLNSLHCCTAACDNALAESQARNRFFGYIHVPHPITHVAQEILSGRAHQHVILTGHAGDGKSTIAVELLKQLLELPSDQPLDADIPRRADVTADGLHPVSIVKDFSEWSKDAKQVLIQEIL